MRKSKIPPYHLNSDSDEQYVIWKSSSSCESNLH